MKQILISLFFIPFFCFFSERISADIRGKVVAIEGENIHIDIGKEQGISNEMVLKVLRKDKEIATIKVVGLLGKDVAVARKIEGAEIRIFDEVFFEKREKGASYGKVLGISGENIEIDLGKDKGIHIGKMLEVERHGSGIATLKVIRFEGEEVSVTKKISGTTVKPGDRVIATFTAEERKRKIAREEQETKEERKREIAREKVEEIQREELRKKRQKKLRAEKRRSRKLSLLGDFDWVLAYKNFNPTNEFFKSKIGNFDAGYLGLKLHFSGGTSRSQDYMEYFLPREPFFDLELGCSYGEASFQDIEYIGNDGIKHPIESIGNRTFDLALNYNLLWLSPFPGVIPYLGVGAMFGQIWVRSEKFDEGETTKRDTAKFGNDCYTTNFGVMLHWKSGLGVILQYQKSFSAEYTDWKMISIGVSIWKQHE